VAGAWQELDPMTRLTRSSRRFGSGVRPIWDERSTSCGRPGTDVASQSFQASAGAHPEPLGRVGPDHRIRHPGRGDRVGRGAQQGTTQPPRPGWPGCPPLRVVMLSRMVWGVLAAAASKRGRPRPQNDRWIAASCLAYGVPADHARLSRVRSGNGWVQERNAAPVRQTTTSYGWRRWVRASFRRPGGRCSRSG